MTRKNATFFRSLSVALHGIGFSIYSGRNFRIQCGCFVLVILLGLFFQVSIFEWLFIFQSGALVLAAELFNTSIELSIDLTTRKRRLRAMLSKDIAAGAVLLCSLYALGVGIVIFLPRVVGCIATFSY